jgi:large subunit ribosomal protein L30
MHIQLRLCVELHWKKCLTVNFFEMAKIKITQVKSGIDRPERQKRTLKALGFSKVYQTVELEATPQILGMVAKVNHLVKVEN